MHKMADPLVPGGAEATRPRPSDQTEAWRAWPAQQLWLWRDLAPSPVRARMRSVLADALGDCPTVDIERVAALAEADEPGAAWRLTARLLCRQADRQAWQWAHDLAASALLLAGIEYRDERAALEFLVLVQAGGAGSSAGWRFDAGRYPPPLDRPGPLRARLHRQAGLALSLVAASCPGWGRTLDRLDRWRDGDPLAGLTASGQQVTGPGKGSGRSVRNPGRTGMQPNAEACLPASIPIRRHPRVSDGRQERHRRVPQTDPAGCPARLPPRRAIRPAMSGLQPAGLEGALDAGGPAHSRWEVP